MTVIGRFFRIPRNYCFVINPQDIVKFLKLRLVPKIRFKIKDKINFLNGLAIEH